MAMRVHILKVTFLLMIFFVAGCLPNGDQAQIGAPKKKCLNIKLCDVAHICTFATSYSYGSRQHWTHYPERQKYVKEAKRRGLMCDVQPSSEPTLQVSILEAAKKNCHADTKFCTNSKLCEASAWTSSTGQVNWKRTASSREHVTEAKRRGLTCGVKDTSVPTPKSCDTDPSLCNKNDLCEIATWRSDSVPVWETHQKVASHVKEAKSRGLSCGVNKTIPKSCDTDPSLCTVSQLCNKAARTSGSQKVWKTASYAAKYIAEAKKNGVSCNVQTGTTTSATSSSPTATQKNNTAELQQLQREREMLAANLQAMQQMMDQQERLAQRSYKACIANCFLNNKAGKGFSAALSGMAQCNMSCAPLKYGGAAIPPSWERDKRRYQTVDCMITRISKKPSYS